MRKLFIAGAVALALCGLGGSAHAQHYTFHSYGQSEGLKNLSTRCMLQDKLGFLWVCTEDGLFRFDGSGFETMPMETRDGPYITGMTQDAAGRIWVATNHTLLYYDSAGNSVGPHTVAGSGAGPVTQPITQAGEELEFDLHASLATDPDDPDRLYFVSRHRLLVARRNVKNVWQVTPYFDSAQTAAHPELTNISFVHAHSHGQLWLGCGVGLCSVSENTIRFHGKDEGLPEEQWRMAFVDRLRRVWVRGERDLFRLDPETRQPGRPQFVPAAEGLPLFSIGVRDPAIIEDQQGRVLINLIGGIGRFEDNRWRLLKERTDLPPYAVSALFADRQGSVWLGLEGHGLARWLGYDQVESWTVVNGLSSNVVWNFARDRQGRLWVATERNLERMSRDLDKIEPQMDARGDPMRRIQTLALTEDGHIWSGSDNGKVIDYDPETRRAREAAKLHGVFQLFPDSSGRIWICTLDGLFYVNRRDGNAAGQHIGQHFAGAQRFAAARGPQGRVYEGLQDRDGTLWFISDSGLFRLSGDAWSHIRLPADYRPVLDAQIVMAQDGTLWISGLEPLLMHLRVEGDTAKVLDRVSSPALSSNDVYLVEIDRRGWLWVGTGNGLNVFNGQRWTHFTAEDGLVWNDLDSNGFYEDTDGTIWIATGGGMSHLLHPERVFQAEPLSLWVGDARIGDTVLSPRSGTEVPWGRQPLTVHLSSLDFKHEQAIGFRYRIEGLGEDWQDTAKHDLRYPPLSPGKYRLAVIALNAFEGQKSAPVYLSFTVLPPWWKARGVLATEIAVAALLFFLVWRWNVRALVARQRHLEALVLQRTHELEQEKAELLKTRAALQEQATHDPLTGLLNHGAIIHELELEMERAGREGSSLALVLVDLDHFKQVNDSCGHVTGDCVLKEYAERLRLAARPYDALGRYGGEELMMIFPGFSIPGSEERLAAMHAALCTDLFDCNGYRLQVTCSLGAAWYRPGLDSTRTLIERADRALYAAKARGRNCVEVG